MHMLPRVFIIIWITFIIPTISLAQPTSKVIPAEHEVRLTGFTRARATLNVISEVNGRCLEIFSDVGLPVPDDGILVRIDPTFARLDLEANRIHREQILRQVQFDRQEVERYRKLVASKSSAKTRLEQLELALDQSSLKLAQLENEGQRFRELLSRYSISAQAGWLLIERFVEPGEWVASGKIIAKTGDFQKLVIPIAVTRAELASLLRNKQNIPLSFPDEGLNGTGRIHTISPDFDPVSRKFKVEIAVDEDTWTGLFLKQGGIRVEIPVLVSDPMQAYLVPTAAVEERYEEHWLTEVDGRRIRVVVLGPSPAPEGNSGDWLRITSPEIKPDSSFLLPR